MQKKTRSHRGVCRKSFSLTPCSPKTRIKTKNAHIGNVYILEILQLKNISHGL